QLSIPVLLFLFLELPPPLLYPLSLHDALPIFSSLTRTLALSDSFPKFELNNNIVNLANTIGYKTYWLSNQGQIGVHESPITIMRSEEHTSELQSRENLVCRLLLEKKNNHRHPS